MHISLNLWHMAALALVCTLSAAPAWAGDTKPPAPWPALGNGSIVLLRHANAPGVGDPPGFTLQDCSTQRNLDGAGREQAVRIGQRFKNQGIKVGAVLTSQWCRCKETAQLAFPGMAREEPAFNSFFGQRSNEPAQTEAARARLLAWRGPGALVVITHQVNITALTGLGSAPGDGVVLRRTHGALTVVGTIAP